MAAAALAQQQLLQELADVLPDLARSLAGQHIPSADLERIQAALERHRKARFWHCNPCGLWLLRWCWSSRAASPAELQHQLHVSWH